MKKAAFITGVLSLVLTAGAYAQVIRQAINTMSLPKPATGAEPAPKYRDVEGSAYYNPYWEKGVVKLNDGRVYADVNIKFDQVEQALMFKTKSGDSVILEKPVAEFKIASRNTVFRNGYNGNKNAYYEVLADGTTQLLKSTAKTINDVKAYPYGTGEVRSIKADDQYYLYKNNKLIRLKQNEASVLAAIGDKQPELTAYIRSSGLNMKNAGDLEKLMEYYNSL